MAKTEFKQGDAIVGKKWSGNPIIGIYEYTNHTQSLMLKAEDVSISRLETSSWLARQNQP